MKFPFSKEEYFNTKEEAETSRDNWLKSYHPNGYGTIVSISVVGDKFKVSVSIPWGCD